MPGQPSSRPSDRELIAGLMCYPGCFEYDDVLEWVCRKHHQVGPTREFPADFLYVLRHGSRVLRSDPAVPRLLAHDDDLYQAVRNAYQAITGRVVSRTPPSYEQICLVPERLAQDADAVREIIRRLPVVEVAHANTHGNLLAGTEPDWAHPDEGNVVFGDGSIFDRYSNVTRIRDPQTDRLVLHGSRAASDLRARYQAMQRRVGADEKNDPGINFMALYTWTRHGVIVVAIDWTFGGEAPVLIPMIEAVASAAAGGVHTLVYDRVVSGWLRDYIMAALGIETINKAVARTLKRGEQSARDWLRDLAIRRTDRPRRRPLTQDELNIEVNRIAAELLEAGHLPAGVSIYKTTRGYDLIDSDPYRFTDSHIVDGVRCTDRFVVDDETLYLLDAAGCKGEYCPAIRSTRERTTYGTWGRRTIFSVPCEHGGRELEMLWTPSDRRGPGGGNDRPAADRLVGRTKPAPRRSDAFTLHNRRSTAEGRNHWVKATLAHHGRAAHLDPNMQMIDFFGAAELINSMTWQRHPDARPPFEPARGAHRRSQ